CATAWLQAMIEAESDERSQKRIVVVDEGWRILSSIGIGEWLQQSFKLSRAFGFQNIAVLLRLSDLHAAGAEGSRELRLAEGLLADAETKVCYAQPPDQRAQARELLGLTDTEAELLPQLRRGWALWKVGQRSFLVQHRLSSHERELVDTDARMLVRAPACTASSTCHRPAALRGHTRPRRSPCVALRACSPPARCAGWPASSPGGCSAATGRRCTPRRW